MSTPLAPLDARVALRGLLGRGGMGEVHRGWDASLERAVAVKFIRGGDQRERERLVLEARLQARVEHPGVVRVLEVGALGGRPCIVLQLVEGPSLAQLAGELDLATKVEVLRQAAEGLHAAHLQGLIHRDVKPGNVLVEQPPEGGPVRAYVGDFGLAHDEEGGLTRTGFPAGTVDFMAPEQALGQGPIDFRADVFSLGATLYAVLAGRPPFRLPGGDARDPGSALQRLLQEPPPPLPAGVPRDVARVAARALEKDPRDRYPSARAFAEDLGRFQRGEPVLARPAPLLERALRWARRNPVGARAVGVAILAVLLGGGAALAATRRSERASQEAAALASEAQELHQRMTLEALLPVHDLSPARAEVRAVLARAEALGQGQASGPAAFLEGRAHQLLGEDAAALAALDRAWSLGFRVPEVAYALSVAEGERFRAERARARAVEAPAEAARLVEAAARRWRDPAVARLASLPGRGDALGRLAQVRIALLEERFQEAHDQAQALAAARPALVEALELALAARSGLVMTVLRRGDLPATRAAGRAALEEGEAALAIARSSVPLRVAAASLRLYLVQAGGDRKEIAAWLEGAERLAGEALRIDPGSAAALRVAADAVSERARRSHEEGLPFQADLERGLALAARATEVAPQDPDAWAQHVYLTYMAANALRGVGADIAPLLELGLASARRVRELEPGPPRTASEGMLHVLRAGLAQQRGDPDLEDAERAVALGEALHAAGTQPLASLFLQAQALGVRASARALTGQDPFADFRAAWKALGEVRALAPDNRDAPGQALSLLNDWTYLAILEGRTDVPLDEGEALGRAWLAVDPGDLVTTVMVGGLRMGQGLFALRRGEAAAGERRYREGHGEAVLLLASPLRPAILQALADFALEKAWVTRRPADAAAAEASARLLRRESPADPEGHRILASALLLTAELAAAPARRALLTEALAEVAAAAAAGKGGPPFLALRARLKERLEPGSGAGDLAAARRGNPRLYLLQGL